MFIDPVESLDELSRRRRLWEYGPTALAWWDWIIRAPRRDRSPGWYAPAAAAAAAAATSAAGRIGLALARGIGGWALADQLDDDDNTDTVVALREVV